jgi:hypothetical protein
MAFDFKNYARLGAQSRLAELHEEMNAILAAFPDLRGGGLRPSGGRRRAAASSAAAAGPNGAVRRRRRKPMTAAQKRAVGIRMKKYWAERRKREAKS